MTYYLQESRFLVFSSYVGKTKSKVHSQEKIFHIYIDLLLLKVLKFDSRNIGVPSKRFEFINTL